MAQQQFSIYLLKENFDDTNSIKPNYKDKLVKLNENEWDNQVISEASLYLQFNEPKTPLWKNYFNIKKEIPTQSQGSILFLPIKNNPIRYFAITFGHSYHALLKNAIDHNFGLITTLNALQPGESIRVLDTVFPESARRERIQSPSFTNLSFFNFNKHESLVKSLHGKVRNEYKDIFNNITGTLSFKCNSTKTLPELKRLCEKLFEIFSKKDYELEFPELTYIKPENDPDKIKELDQKLLDSIHKSYDVMLSIPNFIDLTKLLKFTYNGIDNISEEYDDISFMNYLDYITKSKLDITSTTLKDLYEHSITCIDEDNGQAIDDYSIYECISFETIDVQGEIYYLSDGGWYKINKDYINLLKSELDPIFIPKHRVLSNYSHNSHKNEGGYNSAMENKEDVICLDKKSINPKGQTPIEPCDLLSLEYDGVNFMHVKVDTKSSALSHLFNQGVNSLCLIRANQEAKSKLWELIKSKPKLLNALDTEKYTIVYGIITHKDPSKLSDNLPLFSRISLFRNLEQLKVLDVSCKVIYIPKQ